MGNSLPLSPQNSLLLIIPSHLENVTNELEKPLAENRLESDLITTIMVVWAFQLLRTKRSDLLKQYKVQGHDLLDFHSVITSPDCSRSWSSRDILEITLPDQVHSAEKVRLFKDYKQSERLNFWASVYICLQIFKEISLDHHHLFKCRKS